MSSSEDFCDPLDKNDYTLRLISQFTILFSLLGSLFVILVYTCYKETRNFAYKLILQISISDFIYCTAHFFGEGKYLNLPISPGALCTIQAFLVNFGREASFMWSMIVAWTLYSTVVLTRLDIQKKFWIYAIYGYLLPLTASVVPFFTDNYGPVGYRCWVTLDAHDPKGKILRFALLYIPLWIIILFNSLSYYKIIRYLKDYMPGGPERRFIRRLRAYPLILVLCWVGATIHSIYILFTCETNYTYLDAISAALSDLNAFFNAIAYGLNHYVQSILVQKFPCLLAFRRCCGCCNCCYQASKVGAVHPTNEVERLDSSSCSEIEMSMIN